MQRRYLVRRFGIFLAVVWGASTLNFIIPRLSPGDPIEERFASLMATGGLVQAGIEEMIKAYRQQFGLDQPLWLQYLRYLENCVRFDFGYSIALYPAKVTDMILNALPWTIGLLLVATLFAFTLGSLIGALLAWPRTPGAFQWLVPPLMVLSAVPYYLLGLILLYIFAFTSKVLPLSGGYETGTIPSLSLDFVLDVLKHSLLPGLSIVLASLGGWALGMRGMMVTTAGEDYINLAEAKGLPDRFIFLRYAVRNALLPQFTSLAIALGHIISGSILVEVVFGFPGIGSLLYRAVSGSDYFVIYAIVYMLILAIALATFVIDVVYPLLDPRISYQRR
jgi:peptide/nickel transport system permease protein